MPFRLDFGPLSVRWGSPLPELTVFLVRHGQSVLNADRQLHFTIADPEAELTPRGHAQAEEGAVALLGELKQRQWLNRKIRLYHSDYVRAHQTANHFISALEPVLPRFDYRMDDRIRELEFGILNGLSHQEVEQLFPSYHDYQDLLRTSDSRYYVRRMGGESPADVADRCRSFIGAMYRDYEKHGIRTFVVVNHGLTSRVLAKLLLKQNRYWYQQQRNPQNMAIRLLVGKTDHGYIHRGVEND